MYTRTGNDRKARRPCLRTLSQSRYSAKTLRANNAIRGGQYGANEVLLLHWNGAIRASCGSREGALHDAHGVHHLSVAFSLPQAKGIAKATLAVRQVVTRSVLAS
jgi:hypothetical protein